MAAERSNKTLKLIVAAVIVLVVTGLLAAVAAASKAAPAAPAAPAAAVPTTEALATTVAPAAPVAAPTTVAAAPAAKAPAAQPSATSAKAPAAKPAAPKAPVAPKTPKASNPNAYAFMTAGQPARWDPCTTIHWAFNPDHAPAGALELATEAIARLQAATGLDFAYAGTTTFKPLGETETAYPAGIDAVIAFADRSEYPHDLTGNTFGIGGYTATSTNQGPRIVHGGIVLDAKLFASIPAGFAAGQHRGGAILHELGHMVGLAHVDDATQIMHPSLTTDAPAEYNTGDHNGLDHLGAKQGCFAK